MRPCWLCHIDDFFVLREYYQSRLPHLCGVPHLHVNIWLPSTTVEPGYWVGGGGGNVSTPSRSWHQAFVRGGRRWGGRWGLPRLSLDKCKKRYNFTWTISPVSSETRFTDAIIVSSGINSSCIFMAIMAAAAAFIDIWSASNRRKTRKK